MNKQASIYIQNFFNVVAALLIVATPLMFWNLTSDIFDGAKFVIIIILTSILLILWLARSIVEGKVTIRKTPLDIPLLILLTVLIISTFFSQSRFISGLGDVVKIHNSLAAFTTYIILYFILVSNIKSVRVATNMVYMMIGVGVLLSALSLSYYFGLFVLPFNFIKSADFSPTGSAFSTSAFLLLTMPFLLVPLLKKDMNQELATNMGVKKGSIKFVSEIIYILTITLFSLVIIVTGTLPIYIALVAVVILTLLAIPSVDLKKNLHLLAIPVLLSFIVAIISFLPIGGSKNFLHAKSQSYPREIQLPLVTSWKVSASTFRDSPFWGSGLGTYFTNFTLYKPLEFNTNPFWNVRFETPSNEFLGFLAYSGALGLLSLLLLALVFISSSIKSIGSDFKTSKTAISVAGIAFFILLALHSSTLVLWVIGVAVLALYFSINKHLTQDLSIGISATPTTSQETQVKLDPLPVILTIITLIGIGYVYYNGYNLFLADYHHRQALQAARQNNLVNTYNELVVAKNLSQGVDLYHTNLAQTNFDFANAIALTKGPSQASPSGSLTDQDKQNISTFLSQAINEGRVATTLNPNNPANWEILGSIYRQISGVAQNALAFSLDSYGRAMEKDPLNPVLRLTVGGIYYSVQNYDLAIRFFSDAANLKPDYANAYYNLAIASKDKGDLQSAAAAAQKTMTLLDPKSQDYKLAANLFSDLQARLASASAAQKKQVEAPQSTPTDKTALEGESKTSSSLQNKNLPKVLDLPNQSHAATPAAVQKSQP